MDEKEQLKLAKEHLKSSLHAVRRDLKLYGKAIVNRNNVILKNVGNNVVNMFKKFTENAHLSNLNKEKKELERERKRIEEEIKKITERLELDDRIEKITKKNKEERKLKFRSGVKQKVSSVKSGFGKIKNSIIERLKFTNIDVKLRNAFDHVQVWGLSTLNTGMNAINKAKDGVVNFTSEQIANYYLWKFKQQEKKESKERDKRLFDAELMAEEQIMERTFKHKRGMETALNELDNKTKEEVSSSAVKEVVENNNETEKDRKLNLKLSEKQKVNSVKSKFGKVKNSLLNSLNMANIDVKLRNAFDHAQIWGLSALNTGMNAINKAKDGVVSFTSEQIAKYSEWRERRQVIREHNDRVREHEKRLLEAERMATQQIKDRTLEHKKGMIEALNAQEREQYDAKHIELSNRKRELINNLVAEKNKLLNKQVVYDEAQNNKINYR